MRGGTPGAAATIATGRLLSSENQLRIFAPDAHDAVGEESLPSRNQRTARG